MKIMEIINITQGIHASTACSAGGLPEKTDRWLVIALVAQRHNQCRAARTAGTYRDALLRLIEFFGNRPLLAADLVAGSRGVQNCQLLSRKGST